MLCASRKEIPHWWSPLHIHIHSSPFYTQGFNWRTWELNFFAKLIRKKEWREREPKKERGCYCTYLNVSMLPLDWSCLTMMQGKWQFHLTKRWAIFYYGSATGACQLSSFHLFDIEYVRYLPWFWCMGFSLWFQWLVGGMRRFVSCVVDCSWITPLNLAEKIITGFTFHLCY